MNGTAGRYFSILEDLSDLSSYRWVENWRTVSRTVMRELIDRDRMALDCLEGPGHYMVEGDRLC